MKSRYISDLREGDIIEDVFLVSSKAVGNTRTGDPYMKLSLSDKSGSINAVKWGATQSEIESIAEMEYVTARGSVGSYHGQLQLRIDSIQKPSTQIDPSDFLPVSQKSGDEMFEELMSILDEVKNPQLRALLETFFEDEQITTKFKEAPAAIKVHHAYLGGLLEHTLNVVKSCALLAAVYPEVNRDILLTAAALHDIGKMEEYEWKPAFRFTDAGHFVGHVVGGAMMVKEAADRIDGFDEVLNLALQHAILSHHGHKEYGSPKLPKSLEAMIVHTADELDADAAMYRTAVEDAADDNDSSLFTKRHFFLERPLFKGLPTPNEPEEQSFEPGLFSAETEYDPFAD